MGTVQTFPKKPGLETASGIMCTRLMVPEILGKTPMLSPVVILDPAGRWSSSSLHPAC